MKNDLEFDAHVFICTNERENGKSCAAKGSQTLRDDLKKWAGSNPNWKGKVRVNAAGCLGHCERGIASVIYPKNEWHVDLQSDSVAVLQEALLKILPK